MRIIARITTLSLLLTAVSLAATKLANHAAQRNGVQLVDAIMNSDSRQIGRLLGAGIATDKLISGRATYMTSVSQLASPIHVAILYGDQDTVLKLLPHANNYDVGLEDGTTPLMLAAERGMSRVVDRLLRLGADPNLVDASGASAVDRAHSIRAKFRQIVAEPESKKFRSEYEYAILAVGRCIRMLEEGQPHLRARGVNLSESTGK